MFRPVLLLAALMLSQMSVAEDRETKPEAAPAQYELANNSYDARSFFEPKTEADINAMATLDYDLEMSLDQEALN